MTVRYRSRTDIVAQMVQVASQAEGVTTSFIAYRALLTLKQLNEYIPLLLKKGFLMDYGVSDDGNERLYKATEKGNRFLQIYGHLVEYLPVGPQH